MAKYDKNGCMVEVVEKLKSGQYLILKVFTGQADDWEDEDFYTGGELFIIDEVFSSPPTEKLDQKIKNLSKDINFLHGKKRELEQEVREVEKAGEAKIAKYKKYEQLKNLDMFLDGKITHFVHERYGTIKIITSDEAECDCRDGETKLLTLFGRSNGNLEWNLNDYSDGSGSHFTVVPCFSYTEAHGAAQSIVDDKMKENYTDVDVIRSAKKYDLKIDPEYVRRHKEKEQAKKEKETQKLEERLAKLRESGTE